MPTYEITELARKFAPWSISKVGVAATCPSQFQHKYILKTPETTVPSVNRVGTAAHHVLELRIGGASHEDAKAKALDKTPLTSNEMDSLRTLEEPIEWFMRKWDGFCRTTGVAKLLIEEEWGITADFKPTGFFASDVYFRGKVDLAVITNDGDLVVIDHKSGMAKDIQRDHKFKYQLNSYAVMALANVDKLAGVRSGIHFLQGDESKRIQWLPYVPAASVEKTYVPWLYAHINNCAADLLEPFIAKPKMRWPCEWCSYQTSCAALQEMLNGAQG